MKLVTNLAFKNGECRQAFEFYAKALGGTIRAMLPYSDAPPEMPVDPKYKDWLMHAWMDVGDQSLMGADSPPEYCTAGPMNGFSVSFHTDDPDEARKIYAALLEGGTPTMPMNKTFWSPAFGALNDKFGVPWMINTFPEMPK
ncbi:VOC family protein [soil metagenome]